eukprot:TRINITY_DN4387_c0_g1_i1.p1 TRINITY_DN4387_c0_g1~~TRINITY_DN4387_c0_g1_i1.p1  ORF type:complete len:247 (-),score=68.68 TRINITY_DN4387_c0_g1_i1:362-1102(-)
MSNNDDSVPLLYSRQFSIGDLPVIVNQEDDEKNVQQGNVLEGDEQQGNMQRGNGCCRQIAHWVLCTLVCLLAFIGNCIILSVIYFCIVFSKKQTLAVSLKDLQVCAGIDTSKHQVFANGSIDFHVNNTYCVLGYVPPVTMPIIYLGVQKNGSEALGEVHLNDVWVRCPDFDDNLTASVQASSDVAGEIIQDLFNGQQIEIGVSGDLKLDVLAIETMLKAVADVQCIIEIGLQGISLSCKIETNLWL